MTYLIATQSGKPKGNALLRPIAPLFPDARHKTMAAGSILEARDGALHYVDSDGANWTCRIGDAPGEALTVVRVIDEVRQAHLMLRVVERTRVDGYVIMDCTNELVMPSIPSGIDPPQAGWYPVAAMRSFSERAGLTFLDADD
ncbi:MAG: hypothetical protein HQ526_06785 [Actinobacteria bacterium]|nr:hypothetical protein [Actinomycetota bacterium]